MTSAVEIANMALAHVGSKSKIDSFTEASKEAQVCQTFYATSRDITLAAHDWGFARKVLSLAVTSNEPLNTAWSYEYTYPSDCIRMIRLLPEVTVPHEFILGVSADGYRVIWTNLGEAFGEYTVRVTDTAFFPTEFIWAVSWQLASAIAMQLTGEPGRKQLAEQQFRAAISSARATDYSEQHRDRETDSEFIRARS